VSVRQVLVVINVIALAALGVFAYISVQRTREKKTPQNLVVFHDDDTLEGRHLERVLGWCLFFAAIIAIALPVYWLREPNRQHESVSYFDDGAISRGATLFANSTMPAYDQAKSLQCANCHGTDLGGGSTSVAHTFKDGTGAFVFWRAPALNTVLQRFTPDEVDQIITFGRPGTPMQAWGVEGGGPKNDQSILDLVAYVTSRQLTATQAKQQTHDAVYGNAKKKIVGWAQQPQAQLTAAQGALSDAQKALAKAQKNPKTTADELKADQDALDTADKAFKWAQDWSARRQNVSEGQLLFEVNCARCHTLYWSIFDPTAGKAPAPGIEKPENVIGQPGGGAFGPDLSQEKERFTTNPSGSGVEQQIQFITQGSVANAPYGNNGVGTGRMPGFGGMLTKEQIAAIVTYEREGLDKTTDELDAVSYPGAKYKTF
jgi:mono/diheme cytochrome c family protein